MICPCDHINVNQSMGIHAHLFQELLPCSSSEAKSCQ